MGECGLNADLISPSRAKRSLGWKDAGAIEAVYFVNPDLVAIRALAEEKPGVRWSGTGLQT